MNITKPTLPDSYGFFSKYINQVTALDVIEGLISNTKSFEQKILGLKDVQLNYSYGPGKWNIKQVVGHITDTERIFSYRILRFARKDKTSLPGFDEELFETTSNDKHKDINQLMEEFKAVRHSTILLLKGLDESVLDEVGIASNFEMTPRALSFACLGHCIHHTTIIDERYLV
jgi:uncharacterized damage-inducible protein DinB